MAKKKAAPKKRQKKPAPPRTGKGLASGHRTQDKSGGGVRIRMYCQGLGDCFLLTFPSDGSAHFHMLIDCGLILGTPHADDRIKQVADHIAKETGGMIDLLVCTHEHWDHISGFVQAKEVFGEPEKLKIKQTWLAWTEDPNDALANKLRQEREEKKKKLAVALAHFRQLDGSDGKLGVQLAGLTSFFGVDLVAAADEGLGKTAQAMKFLREQNAHFLKPGEMPPALESLSGIDIFVLGPPTDEKLLRKDLPSKKDHETYEEETQHGHSFASLAGLDVPDETGQHENQPFEDRYGMPLGEALTDPYFAQMYDNGLDEHPAAWRRIDDVGMFAATDLALQLDADTNNTSLALAIRLRDRRVLLFPGDAQVGNWESWHQIKFHDGRTTMPELLANTVVYKVGHHGSHNATLSKLGLDMMTSPELLALLPVDEDIAHNNKGWLRMPFIPLMTELRKRTQGRILRADHDVKHPATDPDANYQPIWTASAETFNTDPKRSLYLEVII